MVLTTASVPAKEKDMAPPSTTVKALTMAMASAKLTPGAKVDDTVATTREMLAMVNMMAMTTAYRVATIKITSITLTMPFKTIFMRVRKAMVA